MRLGLNLRLGGGVVDSGVIVNAVGMGQSLINKMDSTSFLNACPSGSVYVNTASDGSALNKSVGDQITQSAWVDNTGALADGVLFTSMLSSVDSNFTARTDVNVVLFQIANSERNYVTSDGLGTGEVTPTEWEASLDYFITRCRAEFGADVKIIFGFPHRRTSGTAQENYGFQQMRQVYIDKVDNDANIYGVEHCDIDLVDATHHTTAGTQEFGTRMGNIASGASQDYPVLQTATIDYGVVTGVLNSDVTAPSSGVGQVAMESGGAERTGSSLTRSSESTIQFTLGDNQGIRIDDSPYMRIGSGLNSGLASTNADTLNNSADNLPARSAYVQVTDGNVITNISDVVEFWDAKYSRKTFGTGDAVTDIEGLKGAGFETRTGSTNAEYDSTAFGGRGGIKCVTDTNCLQNKTAFTAGATHTIFYAIDIPSSPSGDIRMHQFGVKNGASDTDTGVFANGSDVSYYRNQANGATVLGAGASGGKHIMCLRFNSLSSCDFFIDSTTASVNFDPRDDFSAWQYLHLFASGGGSDGLLNGIYGAFGYANTALSDSGITTIINELGTEFSVPIS